MDVGVPPDAGRLDAAGADAGSLDAGSDAGGDAGGPSGDGGSGDAGAGGWAPLVIPAAACATLGSGREVRDAELVRDPARGQPGDGRLRRATALRHAVRRRAVGLRHRRGHAALLHLGGDGDVFLVEQRIEIPYRLPTAEELAALGDVGDAQIPYASLPWLRRGDIELQIDYTISNLATDQTVDVAVTANGFNEFHEYNPGIQIVENEVVPDYSGWERTIRLEPGARVSGTIRQEHFDEIAVDLATVVNGVPNANQIVHPQSHSAVDPRQQMFIPDVIPGLVGVRMGLRAIAEAGGAPPTLVMELTLRAFDLRGSTPAGRRRPHDVPPCRDLLDSAHPALFGPMNIAPPTP
ncbi:MAG: hypothetical protein M5U28_53230 [Sandaracinaceae bacterium]|nr:hypothetical protein [Sandaracinaceae bacterium]